MSDYQLVARDILRQLLLAGPQKGAKLKPTLIREFEHRTGTSFGHAFWNYPKFLSFLIANSDLVDVTLAVGPGDITAQLREQQGSAKAGVQLPLALASTQCLLPALWNAFTNPDRRRRRFFHRVTHKVVHYLEGSDSEPSTATVNTDPDYVEITPAHSEEQQAWMKEFLGSEALPQAKRQVLANLTNIPYSSQVNTAFIVALAEHAENWRRFRAAKVHEHVKRWAEQQGVPFGEIVPPFLGATSSPPALSKPAVSSISTVSVVDGDTRQLLHAAVDALDANELVQILLPASLLVKIAKIHAG